MHDLLLFWYLILGLVAFLIGFTSRHYLTAVVGCVLWWAVWNLAAMYMGVF